MAHFAELDKNNFVLRVIVINNNDITIEGVESEAIGIKFCKSLLGGDWIQTSYNGNIRKNYAGIGYSYDETRDAFISPNPKCHPEVVLDEAACQWTCSNLEHKFTHETTVK